MHILFASDGSPTGVIDWGDIQAGHPACDLSIGFTFFSGQARQEFFEAVGGCSSGDREAALLRALGYGPALMHYGIEESDEEMVRRGREIGLRTLS
jgi:aminoglycoside phosphotransferase (APT) family kinase protein